MVFMCHNRLFGLKFVNKPWLVFQAKAMVKIAVYKIIAVAHKKRINQSYMLTLGDTVSITHPFEGRPKKIFVLSLSFYLGFLITVTIPPKYWDLIKSLFMQYL